MKQYKRVYAEVNMDMFEHNLLEIKKAVKPGTRILAVIKMDAYGHGAVPLAEFMEDQDMIWGYAVATVDEAVILRNHKIKKPILVLGYTFSEQYPLLLEYDIRPTVFSLETAKELSLLAEETDQELPVHIKLDTGMSRIGYQVTELAADEIAQIASLPHIVVEGMFTHFSKADEKDKTFTRLQIAQYETMEDMLEKRGVFVPIRHVSNSAGIMDMPEANFDLVRAGIILYGLWPSDEVNKESLDLKPVLELKSHVIHVKTLEPGRVISYGGTFEVRRPSVIATIPVGYGDGYARGLSQKGYVLIHGKKAPICGRVCMDQFMVDVTDIEDVKIGDLVTLIGTDGEEQITMELLGELSGRFNYEFTCGLGKRIPRIYRYHGAITGSKDYFDD